jgi:hypothetical protein
MSNNYWGRIIFICLLQVTSNLFAQKPGGYNAIYSGTPWFDDRGKVVSAHGANIMKYNDRYYLYGEAHADTSNAFVGFNCYSSADLYNWKFESVALPMQQNGRLGPNRVGERVKVMHCPKTGEFVMLMHTDTLGYRNPCIGYATAASPTGPFKFQGPLLFNGQPIKKWDMGSFQDVDGAGYLLVHGGNIFKLSDDYKSITEQVFKDMAPDCESPAVFRKGNLYYWLASNRTSWERNDNYYYTATSLKGPWISRGIFAPQGTLTWDSQTTFVLPIAGAKDTTYLFMGDRWSYPHQASAATYVWQPLIVSDASVSIPKYLPAWQINTNTAAVSVSAHRHTIIQNNNRLIEYSGNWQKMNINDTLSVNSSDTKGAYFALNFTGSKIGLYMQAGPKGGYATITLRNAKQQIIQQAMIDNYCKYPVTSLKYISGNLPKGSYTLTLIVMGEHAKWSDKRVANYGSTGDFISLDKVILANNYK